MEDGNNLLALKNKLNKIPDEVLKELWIGLHEDEDLVFIWEDEDSPTTSNFQVWIKKYPELNDVIVFIQSAYKIREAIESSKERDNKWQEDEAYMRFEK